MGFRSNVCQDGSVKCSHLRSPAVCHFIVAVFLQQFFYDALKVNISTGNHFSCSRQTFNKTLKWKLMNSLSK